MKVAVIGCDPSDIVSACRLTISRLAKEGHKIYAILAPLNTSSELSSSSLSFSEIVKGQKLLAEIGITQTFLIETFDYSAITQKNADAVNSHIKHVQPSLVIMPSWKSPNYERRVLARASLIACRGIGTILMYELDTNNTGFVPNMIFQVSAEHAAASIQRTNNIIETTITTTGQDIMDIKKKTFTNISTLEKAGSKTINHEVQEEKFESHRTLLLEEDGLF
jgi:LmbE family N-acetylglucosaminyl deacetylase